MGIYVGDKEIKGIYLGDTPVKEVYLGDTKIRPKARTFTISWTEQSNMSSGWTYSDDAAGLTAGDGAFDDFFGYSAVLLNTSGVETAEMTQSGGVFTGAMTTLGNITSGDNVMIKFPIRGIKMSKSGSVVTLSITEELNKTGYQYYAFQTGTLSNPGTAKDAFYLGAYKGYVTSSKLKSQSNHTPTVGTITDLCTQAKANGSGYNIEGFYQRQYINALYMMKYGNPNSQSVVGMGYSYYGERWSSGKATGNTNSQTSATYGTTNNKGRIKLFGLEDRWGNINEWIGGAYTNGSAKLQVQLSGWTGAMSGGENTGSGSIASTGTLCFIVGDNVGMFISSSSTTGSGTTYYTDRYTCEASRRAKAGGPYGEDNNEPGAFYLRFNSYQSTDNYKTGARLMYL